MAVLEHNQKNLWDKWFPESVLADLLAGRDVVPDIGQVRGVFKRALDHEVKAGRLVTWKGKWFPVAGAPFGLGPDKVCYGTAERRELLINMPISSGPSWEDVI
jgi:hypothetical protein